jgi:hypothetical protein
MFALCRRRPRRAVASNTRLNLESLNDRIQPVAGLGAAGDYAILGLHGGDVVVRGSNIVGDIGVGPQDEGAFRNTVHTGTLFLDESATLNRPRRGFVGYAPTGGIVIKDLNPAQLDADAASAAYDALPATQTFGNVSTSLTINSTGGTNVIDIYSLSYVSKTLTLNGDANDVFIINVTGDFNLSASSVQLTGGLTADHVVFNFPTRGPEIDLVGASTVMNGTILAPQRSVEYWNGGMFNGAIIADTIKLHDGARLNFVGFNPPSDTVVNATLSGTVRVVVGADENGDITEPVAGATIELWLWTSEGLVLDQSTTTDEFGNYSFSDIEPGTYSIRITADTETYFYSAVIIGTVDGNENGQFGGSDQIDLVTLSSGSIGAGYNFLLGLNGGGGS